MRMRNRTKRLRIIRLDVYKRQMPISCAIARRSLAESSVVLVEKMRSGAQFSVC